MASKSTTLACAIAIFAACMIGSTAQGAQPASRPAVAPEDVAKWANAECVFIGRLKSVSAGPVGKSNPPVYIHRLTFTLAKLLRGRLDGPNIVCSHSARQMRRPKFPEGKMCVVAAAAGRGGMRVLRVEEQTEGNLAAATVACSLPLGWTFKDGKLVSPWASLPGKPWTAEGKGLEAPAKCSKTHRPALLAGKDITLTAEPVPPAKAIKWTNPDGDGQYEITVANPTDKPVIVPALLSRDGRVLWEESLVILCQGKSYPCPGAKGVSGKVSPTTLKPGQSIATVVNALRLEGPKWPRGGYRIEFQFCLGEKSRTKSFYYLSRHHDKIRKNLGK